MYRIVQVESGNYRIQECNYTQLYGKNTAPIIDWRFLDNSGCRSLTITRRYLKRLEREIKENFLNTNIVKVIE